MTKFNEWRHFVMHSYQKYLHLMQESCMNKIKHTKEQIIISKALKQTQRLQISVWQPDQTPKKHFIYCWLVMQKLEALELMNINLTFNLTWNHFLKSVISLWHLLITSDTLDIFQANSASNSKLTTYSLINGTPYTQPYNSHNQQSYCICHTW